MTVQEYLRDISYNNDGGFIAAERPNYGTQNIADIRGYGYLKMIGMPAPEDFQDEVGRYIVQAVKEKNEREAGNVSNCHKQVWALKIKDIGLQDVIGAVLVFEDTKYAHQE